MTEAQQRQALKLIAAIEKRLDNIEDLMAFTIRADQRFKKRQRVQFSAKADRVGIAQRTKHKARKGRVIATDGFSVHVLMDGYKQPHWYHHQFFEAVGRK